MPLLQKYFPLFSIILLATLIASLFFYPIMSSWIGIILLLLSLGMALFFTIQKHLYFYEQGEISRLKFTRNVLLDLLGLLLTIAAASYLGGAAGTRLGESLGLWVGLITGIIIGFLAAWLVRKLWSRLVSTI
jgi:hypothetical protein